MNWTTLSPHQPSQPWYTDELAKAIASLNKQIDGLLNARVTLDSDEQELKSIPAAELTAKVLSAGNKIGERRLALLVEELNLRQGIITALQTEMVEFENWKDKQPTIEQAERENKKFLIANGWLNPDSDEVQRGSFPGYIGFFTTACRIRKNWLDARRVSVLSCDQSANITQHEQAVKMVEQNLQAMRAAAV